MLKFNLDDDEKVFELLKLGNKITYEFSVNLEERDLFFDWIKILSSPEFLVNIDLDNIYEKEYKKSNNKVYLDRVLFRISASGKEKDLKRWEDNLDCVSKFLNGNYDITYIKGRSEFNAN